MRKRTIKNVLLTLAALLIVGCEAQPKDKETTLETREETTLEETTLETSLETEEEATSKETTSEKQPKEESTEEGKGIKEGEIDGTVRPKNLTEKSKDSSKKSSSTQESSKKTLEKETKPEVKKQEAAKKKSNQEIAKEVLNGSWGSGEDRKNRLEGAGYSYSQVQALVNKMVPPAKSHSNNSDSSSNSSTSSKGSTQKSQSNNTVVINGYELAISNVATQARLDARYQELVNWGSSFVTHKTVGGGSIYLAVHRDSYGWMVQQANSITFKDINGNVKTYHRAGTLGPIYAGEKMWDSQMAYALGEAGDAIAIQTCIEGPGSVSYVHIFR